MNKVLNALTCGYFGQSSVETKTQPTISCLPVRVLKASGRAFAGFVYTIYSFPFAVKDYLVNKTITFLLSRIANDPTNLMQAFFKPMPQEDRSQEIATLMQQIKDQQMQIEQLQQKITEQNNNIANSADDQSKQLIKEQSKKIEVITNLMNTLRKDLKTAEKQSSELRKKAMYLIIQGHINIAQAQKQRDKMASLVSASKQKQVTEILNTQFSGGMAAASLEEINKMIDTLDISNMKMFETNQENVDPMQALRSEIQKLETKEEKAKK